MTQANGATAGGVGANSRGQQQTPTANAQKVSSEAITAAATSVVAEAITTAHEEAGRKDKDASEKGLVASAATAPKLAGNTSSATATGNDAKIGGSGETNNDRQLDGSPRPTGPGVDLRASFLAAVGNTISQTVITCRQ